MSCEHLDEKPEGDRAVLDYIACSLVGVPDISVLLELLGYRDERHFCEVRGCSSLMEFLFRDSFFAQVNELRNELAHGALQY